VNFLDAIKSGKPFRRQSKPPLAHRSIRFTSKIQVFKCWLGTTSSWEYTFNRDELLAEDWEIDETGAGQQERIE